MSASLGSAIVDPLAETRAFRQALLQGLGGTDKRVPAKYLYDSVGSALFDRICSLPEYYLARVENALLARHGREIAHLMGPSATLVEFGAGSLTKADLILSKLTNASSYAPIDISSRHLREMATSLRRRRPNLNVYPIEADYMASIVLPAAVKRSLKAGLFLGSTIGNLDRSEAISFLRTAAALLDGGGLLVGVDLIKHPELLHAAYNDSEGVTAEFNRNLLARANRDLGADFALNDFAHYAFYNVPQRKMEMHLVSLTRQEVRVAYHSIEFNKGDTIHTEDSHKYTPEEFDKLAIEAGLIPVRSWQDDARAFSLHWLACRGGQPAEIPRYVASSQRDSAAVPR